MNQKLWGLLLAAIAGGTIAGAVVWWTSLSPICPDACPLTGERLSVGGYHVNSPTNVTLGMTNVGTLDISLVSYTFNDSSSHQFVSTNWPGLAIVRGATVTTSLLIDGASFTFQHGNVYIITTISSDNVRWSNNFTA